MRYDNLREPISDTDPCGPDLDDEGDQDYLNYMMLASGRLPTKFFSKPQTGGAEAPFDKSSIKLDEELDAIGRLLRRSRDIRLLTLEARLQILAGNLVGFSEAVQGLAIVVSTYWDKFLPLPFEGDNMMRQNTIEGLDDPVQVVLPLQYAAMIEGVGSLPTVTYRRYAVASGKAKARPDEEVLKLPDLDRSLSVDPVRDKQSARPESIAAMVQAATTAHEAITSAIAALKLIRDTFIKNAGHEFAPQFDGKEGNGLNQILAAMDDLLVSKRPELAPAKQAGEEGADGEEEGEIDGAGAPVTPTSMPNHQAARAALEAVSAYFRRTEPSSPAFILVHQSCNLIGRPLVEALAALMPASKATLKLGGTYDFDIDLARMKTITEDGLKAPLPELPPLELPPPAPPPALLPPPEPPVADGTAALAEDAGASAALPIAPPEPAPAPSAPPVPQGIPVFVVRTRNEAMGLMLGAEAFFRAVEPSSPIPLLLEKARGYLNRDFSSIMGELAPKA